MFGIGMTELIVILVIALLIFGPARLPELARSLGRGVGEFRRASNDLRQSLMEATEDPVPPPPAAAPPQQARAENPPGSSPIADGAKSASASGPEGSGEAEPATPEASSEPAASSDDVPSYLNDGDVATDSEPQSDPKSAPTRVAGAREPSEPSGG